MYPELLPSQIFSFFFFFLTGLSAAHSCRSDASQRNFPTLAITHVFLHITHNLLGFKLHLLFGALFPLPCSFPCICESVGATWGSATTNATFERVESPCVHSRSNILTFSFFPLHQRYLQLHHAHRSLFCTIVPGTINTDWSCFPLAPNSPINSLLLYHCCAMETGQKVNDGFKWSTKKRKFGCVQKKIAICLVLMKPTLNLFHLAVWCLSLIFAFNAKPIEAFQCTQTILLDVMYIVPWLYSPFQSLLYSS